MGTYTFPAITTAAASFVNATGATLKTACLTGMTTLGTATGAILVTGTRTYHAAGIYILQQGLPYLKELQLPMEGYLL
jgi:hypothetical protein